MKILTKYQNLLQSEDFERALRKYNTDKDMLYADSVNFQPIDDMDIGDHYFISYQRPIIVPISEILWIRFEKNSSGIIFMWMFLSDGYANFTIVLDDNNIDAIVKMLCERNHNLIYGNNADLSVLFGADFEEFCKLIALHPNENAADIKVDPALLPVPEGKVQEVKEAPVSSVSVSPKPETPYIPPEKQDLESVSVPEDLPFAEEMKMFLHLAKNYPDDMELTLYKPVSASRIAEFETRNNIKLTDELKSLFLFTDGFDVSAGHITINSLDMIERDLAEEWEWGDTKNYVCIGDMIGDGEIILLDLDTENIITNDHGEETDYGDITWLLCDTICNFLNGEIEDEKLEAYISEYGT